MFPAASGLPVSPRGACYREITTRWAMIRRTVLLVLLLLSTPGYAMTAFDFSFDSIDGAPLPMAGFKGKAVLVVNTASQCGFTPQYTGLQALWAKYRDQGLVVLGVPSNDFGGQEPGKEEDIKKFCEVNFDVDFPLTTKQTVVGGKAHPFYKWVASELGEGAAPRWNFHKYLIGPQGNLLGAYPSQVRPDSPQLVKEIEEALAKR